MVSPLAPQYKRRHREGAAYGTRRPHYLRDTVPLELPALDAEDHEIGLWAQWYHRTHDKPTTSLVPPPAPPASPVGGDEAMAVSRVAVLKCVIALDARAPPTLTYLTADLRHHPASEHLRADAPRCCAVPTGRQAPYYFRPRPYPGGAAELRVEVSTIVTEPADQLPSHPGRTSVKADAHRPLDLSPEA